jgi:hypothetical protein
MFSYASNTLHSMLYLCSYLFIYLQFLWINKIYNYQSDHTAPFSQLKYHGQGHAVTQLVEALRYKLEGHGFDSRWCQREICLHNPSGCTMALGLTQPLTEMSTRNISWGVKAADA